MVAKSLEIIQTRLGFVITLVSVVGLIGLAWFKGVDITMALPTVVGLYLTGRTASAVSHVWAASKDPNADTAEIVKELEKRD